MSAKLQKRQGAVNRASRRATRTPAGDAFSQLVVQVFRLNGLLAAAGDALAKPAGQTSARWRVLAAVEDAPETVSHIARAWGLARQSVQRVADELVREGWAAYEENPAHRRARLVRLTPRGGRALHTIQAAQRSWANALGAEIGEADLRQASSILARVENALGHDRLMAEPPPVESRSARGVTRPNRRAPPRRGSSVAGL